MRSGCCADHQGTPLEPWEPWASAYGRPFIYLVHPSAVRVWRREFLPRGHPIPERWRCQVCGWKAHEGRCTEPEAVGAWAAMMPAMPAGWKDFVRSPWRRFNRVEA